MRPLGTDFRGIEENLIMTCRRDLIRLAGAFALAVTSRSYSQEPKAAPGSRDKGAPPSAGTGKVPEKEVNALLRMYGLANMAGGRGTLQLLDESAVQRELGLSDRQIKKIRSLDKESLEAMRSINLAFAGNPDMMQAQRAVVNQQVDNSLRSILGNKQMRRLNQLLLQTKGIAGALSDPQVVAAIDLTPDQRRRIGQVLQQAERQRQACMQERLILIDSGTSMFDPAADELIARGQAAMNQGGRRALDVLYKGQLKKFQSMVGEPFDFQKMNDHPPRKAGSPPEKVAPRQEGERQPANPAR